MRDLTMLPLFDGLPAGPLNELATCADEQTVEAGALILRQHAEAQAIFILLSGHVQFLLRFEGVDDLIVGETDVPGSLLGWSAFRPPFRYTASVRCERTSTVVRLPRARLDAIVDAQPLFGYQLLKRIARAVADRLENSRDLVVQPPWLAQRIRDGVQAP